MCSAFAAMLLAAFPSWVQAAPITNVSGGILYQFDPVAAASYFDNVFQGSYIFCVGTSSQCSLFNQPSEPANPRPDPAQTELQAISLADTFFTGGNLGISQYEMAILVLGLNGFGTWQYRFVYQVQPNVGSIGPLTAWTPVSAVPLPAALPLYATGLGLMGLFGWWRRRRSLAA